MPLDDRDKWCLIKVPEQKPVSDTMCEGHKQGQWFVVDDDGTQYFFDPPTGMQKDMWLCTMRDRGKHAEAMSRLRWFCWECGTVQEP